LPRLLLEALETDSSNDIVAASTLTVPVLERILERLRGRQSLVRLAGAILDDEVMIRLIDGTVEKRVEDLSTGQKCSVSLPIILTEEGKSLILDQPEDS
jgi:ATPase subunit of ABC transporter with duplicated ATPase domains